MNKSIKHIFIISILFLLMIGITSTVSAENKEMTPDQFLGNISSGLQEGDNITITNGLANVTHNYTLSVSNILIKAKGDVTFNGTSTNSYFKVVGNNVTIQGVTFTNCSRATYSSGGAFYWTGNNGTIKDCTFISNKADYGGAVDLYNSSYTKIDNCTFIKNNATYGGGALYINSCNHITVMACTFRDNIAKSGGAIESYVLRNSALKDCKFIKNTANTDGGAINFMDTNDTFISICSFTNCSADRGSAISLTRYTNYCNNCTLNDNNFDNCKANDYYNAVIYNEGNNITAYGGSGALIYNVGTIKSLINVIILSNTTIDVAKGSRVELNASLNTGGCTVISPNFKFIIGDDSITGGLVDSYYLAYYDTLGEVSNKLIVNGSYLYGNNISYYTATLLVKNAVSISSGIITVPYKKDANITLYVISNGKNVPDGQVSVTIDGINGIYTGEVHNGTVNITLPSLKADVYSLTAKYRGTAIYMTATSSLTLKMIKSNATIDVTPTDITYGEDETLIISTDSDMSGNLTITVNNENYSISVNKKSFMIPEQLSAGEYPIAIIYNGDVNFNPKIVLTKFTVKAIATHTNVSVDNTTSIIRIYVNTTDIHGNPVDGTAKIVVTSPNGTTETVHVDIINSQGNVTLYGLLSGTYSVNVTFKSKENYDVSYANCTFKTEYKPMSYDLTATNVYKEFENSTQYNVVLKDIIGNPLEGRTILLSISSQKWVKPANYTVVTSKEGIATLTINLLPGNYKITARFADEVATNNITVIATNFNLEADNIVKYFKNGTEYTVKVTDLNGKPVVNRTVTVSINKATWKNPAKYYIVTNSEGVATLDINLYAGSYSITASICYNSTKSSIKVLPTLTASNLVKNVNKASNLKAKLVDGQGNPAVGREITFTVKDKVYSRTTDSNGVATLYIGLGIGTWSILISNPETDAKTTVSVKVTR